jgi:hypothetical protein
MKHQAYGEGESDCDVTTATLVHSRHQLDDE